MLTFADTMQTPQQPLVVIRNITDPALANVTVPLSRPGLLHRFIDPDAGDTLLVVTAPLPVRGFIKQHDFVEMSLLESIHGVAVHPSSEDVIAEVAPDKVIIGRPGGLTLSSADVASERATTAVRPIFDVAEWRKNQAENFIARQDELIAAAGAFEPGSAHPGPDRPRPFPDVARDVLGSQGRCRSRARRRQAGVGGFDRPDGACGREHPDRPSRAGAERPRQSRDRSELRFAAVESAGLCAPGQVGGSAGEIQERRIRHYLAADRAAAYRGCGSDARVARGQGFFRRRQARQRPAGGRYSRGS